MSAEEWRGRQRGSSESSAEKVDRLAREALDNPEGRPPKDWFMGAVRKGGWDSGLAQMFGTREREEYLDAASDYWDRMQAERSKAPNFDVRPMELSQARESLVRRGLRVAWADRILSFRELDAPPLLEAQKPMVRREATRLVKGQADLLGLDVGEVRATVALVNSDEGELRGLGLTLERLAWGIMQEGVSKTHERRGAPRTPLVEEDFPLELPMPGDRAQAHINRVFYGLLGSRALSGFIETPANQDRRIGESLADDFHGRILRVCGSNLPDGLRVLEYGPGDCFLAASFLNRMQELDRTHGTDLYGRLTYTLIDFSEAMLEDARTNYWMQPHIRNGRVEQLRCDAMERPPLAEGSVDLVLSHELVDDLPTKEMWTRGGRVWETFLTPVYTRGFEYPKLRDGGYARLEVFSTDYESGVDALRKYDFNPRAISTLTAEMPAGMEDVPYPEVVGRHLKTLPSGAKVTVNVGGMRHLDQVIPLLNPETSAEYKLMDYGSRSTQQFAERKLPCYLWEMGHAGHVTAAVNNQVLMEVVEHKAGREGLPLEASLETRQDFLSRVAGERVIMAGSIALSHPQVRIRGREDLADVLTNRVRAVYSILNEAVERPHTVSYERERSRQLKAEGYDARRISEIVEGELASPEVRAKFQSGEHGVRDGVYVTESEITRARPRLEAEGYDMERIGRALSEEVNNDNILTIRLRRR